MTFEISQLPIVLTPWVALAGAAFAAAKKGVDAVSAVRKLWNDWRAEETKPSSEPTHKAPKPATVGSITLSNLKNRMSTPYEMRKAKSPGAPRDRMHSEEGPLLCGDGHL